MAGQHWGERSDHGEPVSFGNRLIEWICAGVSILMFVAQIWYAIAPFFRR